MSTMIVVKTVRSTGRSPIQGRPWPLPTRKADGTWSPGKWVVSAHVADGRTAITSEAVDSCAPMVFGALPDQVAEWASDRAWWMELDDAVVGKTKVGGSRGRLLRPVEGWTRDVIVAWARWCADRAIHVHAVAALRSAGLDKVADRLDATPPIVDGTTSRDAARAARAAAADGRASRAASWAASAAGGAADAAGDAAARAAEAAEAAGDAAGDAAAGDAAGAAEAAEMRLISHRLCEMAGIDTEASRWPASPTPAASTSRPSARKSASAGATSLGLLAVVVIGVVLVVLVPLLVSPGAPW